MPHTITCDSCAGSGTDDHGGACPFCGGSGREEISDAQYLQLVAQQQAADDIHDAFDFKE